MGSTFSINRSDHLPTKSTESFEECQQFRGRLHLRTATGQWRKYEITFDGTQISCQLWTLPIADILVISTLKCRNQASSQCLCIRTIHDETILLRGKSSEEIERWAFVLQKICSLSKMVKEYKSTMAKRQKTTKEVNTPASKQSPLNNVSPQRQRSRSQKARARAERRAEHEQVALAMLTEEKSSWINTWRQSLTDVEMEMMVPDLSSLPDDDESQSVVSGMTSISMRGRTNIRQEREMQNANLKGFKSLPNLRPKSASRELVDKRRGTSDHHSNNTGKRAINKPEDSIYDMPVQKGDDSQAVAVPDTKSVPVETTDELSTVESTSPRTPSRRLSQPLNKLGSESMPMIRHLSTTLSDAPSLPNQGPGPKRITYARSDMI
ncbi:unnamed protein product [Umbelopsis sp. WA50703]